MTILIVIGLVLIIVGAAIIGQRLGRYAGTKAGQKQAATVAAIDKVKADAKRRDDAAVMEDFRAAQERARRRR